MLIKTGIAFSTIHVPFQMTAGVVDVPTGTMRFFGPVDFTWGWRLGMTRASLGRISGSLFFVTEAGLPWLSGKLLRARFFPRFERANALPAWRWSISSRAHSKISSRIWASLVAVVALHHRLHRLPIKASQPVPNYPPQRPPRPLVLGLVLAEPPPPAMSPPSPPE